MSVDLPTLGFPTIVAKPHRVGTLFLDAAAMNSTSYVYCIYPAETDRDRHKLYPASGGFVKWYA